MSIVETLQCWGKVNLAANFLQNVELTISNVYSQCTYRGLVLVLVTLVAVYVVLLDV